MAIIHLLLCLSVSSVSLSQLQGEPAFTFASLASGFLLEERLPTLVVMPAAVFSLTSLCLDQEG